MSKSWKATRRDLLDFYDKTRDEEHWSANWKLTRHPNSTKKHKFGSAKGESRWYNFHEFSSPKHMDRKVAQKDKQRCRQMDRTLRREETRRLINEFYEE